MLTDIIIKNFAIIDSLSIEVKEGMTSISGETGAGKSITLDALNLVLGGKADIKRCIRHGAKACEISAMFDITGIDDLKNYLEENDYLEGDTLALRRIVKEKGNKAYINSKPASLGQLKLIGEHLISIHGQNGNQLLNDNRYQREMVDHYSKITGIGGLLGKVGAQSKKCNDLEKGYKKAQENIEENKEKYQLLKHQLAEILELSIGEGDLEDLESQQGRFEHGDYIQKNIKNIDSLYNFGKSSIKDGLAKVQNVLGDITNKVDGFEEYYKIIESSTLEIEEAIKDIKSYSSSFSVDSGKFESVNEKLSGIYAISKKHLIDPKDVYKKSDEIQKEIDNMFISDEQLDVMREEIKKEIGIYTKISEEMSNERKKYAKKLSKEVSQNMEDLNFISNAFIIDVNHCDGINEYGNDTIAFMIEANKGQPPEEMRHVASGGEQSRISLSIQVEVAKLFSTPTIIFDEVDAGIGGEAALNVGKMLRKLGNSMQVMCVTHQPQVASAGHNHFKVEKRIKNNITVTEMVELTDKERILEISRMLSGESEMHEFLESAKKLLEF
jgi:DNA repair protein RecN (Recombination protein N)